MDKHIKLPKLGLVKVKEGAPTQSVDNQEEIKQLFPNTYGMPVVEFEPSDTENNEVMNVGVILSGGQAPGGHNVITGLFDTIKKMNPENNPIQPHIQTESNQYGQKKYRKPFFITILLECMFREINKQPFRRQDKNHSSQNISQCYGKIQVHTSAQEMI